MKRKNQPGGCYCCCGCEDLAEFMSTQPGVIAGYTPTANWQGTADGCCWTRVYTRDTPSLGYVCDEICVPDNKYYFMGNWFDLPDCIRFGRQIEIKRGEYITLTLFRAQFPCPPGEGCDIDSNPATAICGCKYILTAEYLDFARLFFVIQGPQYSVCGGLGVAFWQNPFLCNPPIIDENPPDPCLTTPPPAPCPAYTTCDDPDTEDCNGITLCWCGKGATVDWIRTKPPFNAIPSGSITFGNSDTYCRGCLPIPPACQCPEADEYVTEPQCVSFTDAGYCPEGNDCPNSNLHPCNEIPGCENCDEFIPIEYCLSPPSFTVVFP